MSSCGPTLLTALDVSATVAKSPCGSVAREQTPRHQNWKRSNPLLKVQFEFAHSHHLDEKDSDSKQDKDVTLSSNGASCTSSVTVKNTFLHFDEIVLHDDSDAPIRSISLPNMFCDEAFPEDNTLSSCIEGGECQPQIGNNQASQDDEHEGTQPQNVFKQPLLELSKLLSIADRPQCGSTVVQAATVPLPSVGAEKHGDGQCKPCAWFWKSGCRWGMECQHCHMCPEGEIRRRKKEKLARLKHAAIEARTQVELSVQDLVQ